EGDEAGSGQEAGSFATDRDALGDLGLGHLDLAAHDGGDVVAGVGDELAHGALGLTGGGMSDTTTGSPLGGGAGGRAGAVVAHGAPARLDDPKGHSSGRAGITLPTWARTGRIRRQWVPPQPPESRSPTP